MDILSTVGVALCGLFVGAIVPYLNSYFKREKLKIDNDTKKLLDEQSKKLQEIQDMQKKQNDVHGLSPDDIQCKGDLNSILEQLRITTGATRVTIWAFHNGSYFTTGNPQRRLTTVFEAMPPSTKVKSEYDIIRGELLNGFTDILRPMLLSSNQNDGGAPVTLGIQAYDACSDCPVDDECPLAAWFRPRFCYIKCEINKIAVGTKFFRVMKELGTAIFWGHIISDNEGKPMGVITFQFNEDSKDANDLLSVHTRELCEKVQQIKASLKSLQQIS